MSAGTLRAVSVGMTTNTRYEPLPTDFNLRLDAIALMLETLDRKGDAEVMLSPDARRLLTQAAILLRREVDALRERSSKS